MHRNESTDSLGGRNTDEKLKIVLKDNILRSAFFEFMKSTYCIENLQFWLDVEEVKKIYGTNEEEAMSKIMIIEKKYLREGSDQEINVSDDLKRKIKVILRFSSNSYTNVVFE